MTNKIAANRSKVVDFKDLHTKFLSLKVGETIEYLDVLEIRKVTNSQAKDNLTNVDYKYLVISKAGAILTVNSWCLWTKIQSAVKTAGTMQAQLKLEHPAYGHYEVANISNGPTTEVSGDNGI